MARKNSNVIWYWASIITFITAICFGIYQTTNELYQITVTKVVCFDSKDNEVINHIIEKPGFSNIARVPTPDGLSCFTTYYNKWKLGEDNK